MYAALEHLRQTCAPWLLALFALALLTGCAGQRTTPATGTHARVPAHEAAREPASTSRRTGLAAQEVGYYLDALQGRLLQKMSREINVVRQGDRIAIEIPGTEDAARLQQTLRSIANVLSEYRFMRVTLHSAPSVGETASVAENRAQDAARTLTRSGVAAWRISVTGGAAPNASAHIELSLEPIVLSDDEPAGH